MAPNWPTGVPTNTIYTEGPLSWRLNASGAWDPLTGTGLFSWITASTPYGQSVAGLLNAAENRTLLGLGTAATTASTDYAPAAQGVTNGNSHNHDGGDGAQIAYSSLSGLPTLPTGTNTGDQAIANTSDATSHTISLSASGGSVQLVEGSNITLTTTGTSGAGVLTIASAGGGSTDFLYFNAAEFIPRANSGCGVSSEETLTWQVNRDLLLFDPAVFEAAQVWFAWPAGWNTFTAKFIWKYSSGSGQCIWGAAAVAFADNTALDTAFGTNQTTFDMGLGANIHQETPSTAAITPAGTVAAGRPCVLGVFRDATNGADTLSVDAALIGVLITKAS